MAQPKPEEHLAAFAAVARASDREILAELKRAYADVGRELGKLARQGNTPASLERQRLLAVKKAILEAQAQFYEKTGDIVARRRVEAAARAIKVSERYDEAVFKLAGRTEDLHALSDSLEEMEAKAPEAMIARMTGSRVPLSERVYRTRAFSQNQLERRINSGLARGLSAHDLAREVQDLVDPRTPGGVRYAALRLARTEINNAYHAMAIRAAELKPWVTKVEWHTSRSHARPDECDTLNGQLFEPADTPRKPHPQCMCYITQVIGDPSKSDEENDDDFLDDLVGGLFDEFLDEHDANDQGAQRDTPPFSPRTEAAAPQVASLPEPAAPPALSGKAALESVRTGLIRRGSLTPKQRKAWREYESSFFVFINNYFRRGRKDVDGKEDARTDRIAAEMDSSFQPLEQDVDVFRGLFRARRLFGDSIDGNLEGFEWEELGYSSTSVDEQMSREFALSADSKDDERVVIRTRVQRGIGASAVSDTRASGGQGEIALQRKTGWRIVRDLGVDPTGVRYLEAEVYLQ